MRNTILAAVAALALASGAAHATGNGPSTGSAFSFSGTVGSQLGIVGLAGGGAASARVLSAGDWQGNVSPKGFDFRGNTGTTAIGSNAGGGATFELQGAAFGAMDAHGFGNIGCGCN